MKKILSLFFLCFALYTQAQTDNKIVIGRIDSLYSTVLNETRKCWIYVPDEGANNTFTTQRYPVVYLLDGDAHFHSVVGMMQQLSAVNGNDICPKMIVVGIPNTDRMRDLSPTHVENGPYLTPSMVKTTGGGESFISFIETELMPYIQAKYPTDPYRMLIGHSLGGLLAMHTLVHHTRLFNAYVAIDPSMWWDNQKLLKETKKALAEKQFAGTSLYLGIANTLEPGMNIKKIARDTSQNSLHIRSILELDKILGSNPKNQLRYQSKYYDDDTHGSIPLITEYDALRFIFDFYPMKLSRKDYSDTTTALIDRIEKSYALRSEKMRYTVKPPEAMLNDLGYQALAAKHYALAGHYFKRNMEYYSKSANVYDSYAEYFDAIGDKENAILYYKKSLELNQSNTNALAVLTRLGVNNILEDLKLDQPPTETGDFKAPDLVELIKLDPTFKLDIRYATANNFTHRVVYPEARAFLQRPAAEALTAVSRELKTMGLGLLIFDGYRPWRITKILGCYRWQRQNICGQSPKRLQAQPGLRR